MAHLFVLDITYTADIAAVEEHLQDHRAFLATHYASGLFLASGRKEPRTGGVILAQGGRRAIDEVTAADPFTVHGVARYTITEFIPTMTGDALTGLREEQG